MTDVSDLAALLRQRRIDLGLTQREVADHAPGISVSLLCNYETGRHSPSATKLVDWAGALGCDLEFAVRPAPPLQTRFANIDELRQDIQANAWARRVAARGKPDDIEEIRRRIEEGSRD